MKKILFKRGFTLIELLVVIAIIGILTAVVMANFTTAKSKSRDAKRVSDIAQLQLALEQVFDRCNEYPVPATNNTLIITSNTSTGCAPLSNFISVVPRDTDSTRPYQYFTNPGNTDYILKAVLENNSTALGDDTDAPGTSQVLIPTGSCDDNLPNGPFNYCVQPK